MIGVDKIMIDSLEIFANHGVLKEENVLGQKFVIDAVLFCDTRRAGITDNIENSVNYAEVCKLIEREMQSSTFNLIEAAAERIAEQILLEYEAVREVTVTVKKPWAPILMSVDTVKVEITRKWHKAYIALGSNMGDIHRHLDDAVKEIDADKRCRVKKVSDFIMTKPVGGVEQDDFLNACLLLKTFLSPRELLDRMHEIEQEAHRERRIRWGPRTLDLDILMYDGLVMDSDDLTIPHAEMHLRDFVLRPLAEIAPNKFHPILRKTVSQLAAELAGVDEK